MSWQIVVGVLIVVAIAVHFGEKAKARANQAKRRALQSAGATAQVSFTREVRERWSADVRAMTLELARAEAGAPWGAAESYRLARDPDGRWVVSGTAAPSLPAPLAEQLEARFQRLPKEAS